MEEKQSYFYGSVSTLEEWYDPLISIVIPTRNEALNLRHVLPCNGGCGAIEPTRVTVLKRDFDANFPHQPDVTPLACLQSIHVPEITDIVSLSSESVLLSS